MYVWNNFAGHDSECHFLISGAFQLYDIDGDGTITYDEMLQIFQSFYKTTGEIVKLLMDEDTPKKVRMPFVALPQQLPQYQLHLRQQRVEKIFKKLDRDKDARLTYDEFVEGSKQDPMIVQVWTIARSSHSLCT